MCTVEPDAGDPEDDGEEYINLSFNSVSLSTDQPTPDDDRGPSLVTFMSIGCARNDATKWRTFEVGPFCWCCHITAHCNALYVDEFARTILRRRASALHEMPCGARG